jgi:hypothetical protein
MCDAWQADNTNVYFAVTGHWIQESVPGQWMVEHALLAFTQMNTAHSGTQLGQALYLACDHLQIISKVSTNNFNISSLLTNFSILGWTHYLRQRCE